MLAIEFGYLVGMGKLAAEEEPKPVTRGHPGRGQQGACGGERRRDGSGRGVGNIGTERQPPPKKKKEEEKKPA